MIVNMKCSQGTRVKLRGFPVKRRLEDFDFEFQTSIDRTVISDLGPLKFVYDAENVVFLNPPGAGKSHLAIALGIASPQLLQTSVENY